MNRIKILHIINSLNIGGAEMMLYKLLATTNDPYFQHNVITLLDKGSIGAKVENLGVTVDELHTNRRRPTPQSFRRLIHLVRTHQPDLIQGWMYHGNLAASVASIYVNPRPPVLWNIRHSLPALSTERPVTRLIILASAFLSQFTNYIIYNANVSAPQHERFGYSRAKRRVIPNGFDIELFKPCLTARSELRNSLGIPSNTVLIGLVGRYHPMKDHNLFLQAAKLLVDQGYQAQFLLIGRDVNHGNEPLSTKISDLGIAQHVHLLGERNDIPKLTAALDIAASSSYYGEGFPNVVGEAMSCGVPCAVTDVGDSSWIVGETGFVVPPREPNALATAWGKMIDLGSAPRMQLGAAARQRITAHFSLSTIVRQYEELYREVLSK